MGILKGMRKVPRQHPTKPKMAAILLKGLGYKWKRKKTAKDVIPPLPPHSHQDMMTILKGTRKLARQDPLIDAMVRVCDSTQIDNERTLILGSLSGKI